MFRVYIVAQDARGAVALKARLAGAGDLREWVEADHLVYELAAEALVSIRALRETEMVVKVLACCRGAAVDRGAGSLRGGRECWPPGLSWSKYRCSAPAKHA